ncbi:mitochondrial 54S ribosomal protein YmL41 [Kalmusia sp. IMI 367209]|nr:mitochondrial 54S ribosomal protein YmL41 [Kalmusia sp. IMI 367209]
MDIAPVTKKIIAFGSKQVFLPKFTIALVRTPKLSPYHARFLVPLNFSKYDLRDYLYHAYSVKVHSIRSFVKQMPVRDTQKQPRHWFREESKKYMTVEMDKPFVWPEEPTDWEPWGRSERENSIKEMRSQNGVQDREDMRNLAGHLRQQASKVLGRMQEGVVETEENETKAPKGEADMQNAAKKSKQKQKMSKKNLVHMWEEQRSPTMLGKHA